MKTAKRICIEDWEITAENGDHFEIKRGKEYITSMDHKDDACTVFSSFWVRVPLRCFAGAIPGP